MSRAQRLHLDLAIGLTLLIAGCGASDGGPVGTGLTASVVGNVVAATAAVEVSIDEAPGVAARTDDAGNFELAGDFSGSLTLRLTTGGLSQPTPLNVPAGSALALSDIELGPDGVEIQSRLQLGFAGRVTAIDCAQARLTVADASGRDFEVALDVDTLIQRRDGKPASCAQIGADRRVIVDGLADAAGAARLEAVRITIGQERPGPIEPAYTVPFAGTVVAFDCAEQTLGVANDFGRTTLRLDATTTIVRRGDGAIACEDIALGDRAVGLGVLRLDDPGVVRATDVAVSDDRRPDLPLRFVGFLIAVDCASGELRLRYQRAVTRVRVTAETEFDPSLGCADLREGDRLSGAGRIRDDRPNEIEASRIRLRRRAG